MKTSPLERLDYTLFTLAGNPESTWGEYNATYETAPRSQMGYGCDSEVASSGSPILDAATGQVIGINHFGDVAGACLNAATQMKNICAHAGALLSCAGP